MATVGVKGLKWIEKPSVVQHMQPKNTQKNK